MAVTNMPGAVGRTSTFALCNVTLPWALRIVEHGIDEAVTEDEGGAEESIEVAGGEETAAVQPGVVATRTVVEFGPDAVSRSLTALMIVGVLVMWFAGFSAAALVRGVAPAVIRSVYANLAIYAGGAALVAAAAWGATFVLARRSS